MKKVLVCFILTCLAMFPACSGDDDVNYTIDYTVTRDSDSSVIAQGSFTAGPNEDGHDGSPATSLYETPDTYVFLAAETAVDCTGAMDIGGGSDSINSIFFYAVNASAATGSYDCNYFTARIDGIKYGHTTSGEGTVILTKIGSSGSGTVKGSFSVPVETETGSVPHTVTGSFTVKRGIDNSCITY